MLVVTRQHFESLHEMDIVTTAADGNQVLFGLAIYRDLMSATAHFAHHLPRPGAAVSLTSRVPQFRSQAVMGVA